MTIELQVFAGLKDYLDSSSSFEIKEGLDLKGLVEDLKSKFPGAKELLSKSRVAINNQFIDSSIVLNNRDVVALIPPSSGG